MKIQKLNKHLFNSLTGFTHWVTATEFRHILGRPVMRSLGALTLVAKKAQSKNTVLEAAEEWQRMFPSKKMVPIVTIEEQTVFAEIHSECPYRGSGNVEGCYRMMEYDRKMMEKIGARFIVVKSQAEPGVMHCEVAITGATTNLPIEARDRLKAL